MNLVSRQQLTDSLHLTQVQQNPKHSLSDVGYAWPRTLILIPARAPLSQRTWNDDSSSRPHFPHLGSSAAPMRRLIRVVCLVSRPSTINFTAFLPRAYLCLLCPLPCQFRSNLIFSNAEVITETLCDCILITLYFIIKRILQSKPLGVSCVYDVWSLPNFPM